MSAMKAINPNLAAILRQLLANPATVICPACNETGFWDNRDNKKSDTGPDFKCKNKDCKGADPIKKPRPYAVWIPEGFLDDASFTPAAPSKRLAPPVKGSFDAMMDDGYGPIPEQTFQDDNNSAVERPLLDRIIEATGPVTDREAEYLALAGRVAAFQDALGKQYEMPWDGASVNAMTFSIWNKR